MAEEAKVEATPTKKGPSLKLIIVIAGLMVVEAVGVIFLVGMLGPKPQSAVAEVHGEDGAEQQSSVEIELVDERFQNMQTGRVWIWDMKIFLKVKKKNAEFVKGELEQRNAEILEGISQIVRRAQHSHLKEPELTTLSRQFAAYLDKSLGKDPDGNSRIERILIPKCKGMQFES